MANQYNTKQIKAISLEELKNVKKEFRDKAFLVTFFRRTDNNSFLLESVLNKIAKKYQHNIPFFRCTVPTPEMAQSHFPSVERLPTTVLVRKGRARETFFGVLPQHKIEEKLNVILDQ
ncbi:MAG TPA: hypothetical protein VJ953_02950 [Saprospiraceae bacterium]|nr:hypothetical protein [Saprospiraceae bacterium]